MSFKINIQIHICVSVSLKLINVRSDFYRAIRNMVHNISRCLSRDSSSHRLATGTASCFYYTGSVL